MSESRQHHVVTSGSHLAALADSRQRNATPAPAKERTRELVKHRRCTASPDILSSSTHLVSLLPILPFTCHSRLLAYPTRYWGNHLPTTLASHLPSFDVWSCLPLPALLSAFSPFSLLLLFILPCTFCLSASPLLPFCLCSSPLSPSFIHHSFIPTESEPLLLVYVFCPTLFNLVNEMTSIGSNSICRRKKYWLVFI